MLGFSRDDGHDGGHEAEEDDDRKANDVHHRGTKGFSVQVPVAVDRPAPGPVLIPCKLGDGGVQVLGSDSPFSVLFLLLLIYELRNG